MFDNLFNSIDALVAAAKSGAADVVQRSKDVWAAAQSAVSEWINAQISGLKFACPPTATARAQACKAELDKCPIPTKAPGDAVGGFDLARFISVIKAVLSLFGL